MGKIVGVSMRPGGKIYNFDAGIFVLCCGSNVIIESENGLEIGTVVVPPRPASEAESALPLNKIYRMANEEDLSQYRKSIESERSAREYCLQCIEKLGLEMSLVSVRSEFDGSKLTFYFTADGRVDFRELVKMLVKAYRVRIELRQIGVRNRAKMCGGLGRCGHSLCCSTFMNDFEPVSIRMAKEQGMLLNPSKISGLCGRLMCCLAFEYDTYCNLKTEYPACGKSVKSQAGSGKIVRQNVVKETVTVKTEEGREIDVPLKEIIDESNA